MEAIMEPRQEIGSRDHVERIRRRLDGGEDADEISKGTVNVSVNGRAEGFWKLVLGGFKAHGFSF
jgi:hypothetical protein